MQKKRFYTTREVAEIFGLSVGTIHNRTHSTATRPFPVRPVKIGNRLRFPVAEIDQLIKTLAAGKSQSPAADTVFNKHIADVVYHTIQRLGPIFFNHLTGALCPFSPENPGGRASAAFTRSEVKWALDFLEREDRINVRVDGGKIVIEATE